MMFVVLEFSIVNMFLRSFSVVIIVSPIIGINSLSMSVFPCGPAVGVRLACWIRTSTLMQRKLRSEDLELDKRQQFTDILQWELIQF